MRIHSLVLSTILALALASAGCSKDPAGSATPEKPTTQTGAAGHAAASAKPGSHDDWCEEHQVPESQCTRCNPALVAAFKATGDWCNEHGVPESQCTQCDPKRKAVRPAKEK